MKTQFQTIILIVFILAFAGAVLAFSGLLSSNTSSTTDELSGTVMIWGVVPNEKMREFVTNFNSNGNTYTINYEEHTPTDFYQDLIVALADNQGPDMVLVSSEVFSQFADKLYTVPYAAYSERGFRDTNIDGAQIFLSTEGVVAFPLLVDPMVTYYNKDLLASRNFVLNPRTWTDLVRATPLFVKRDTQNILSQVAIGLGTSENITHYKDILSTLFLQTGNSIVVKNAKGASVVTLADGTGQQGRLPAGEGLEFFTSFSNPTNKNYSWNRSLPSDLDMFLSGKSAFYIGRASELFTIQSQNPNLNFDVSTIFQSDQATRPITYGSFLGLGILRSAPNFNAAYDAGAKIATMETIDALSKQLSLPPVRRDLLLVTQENPYVSVFFQAATSAFAWPDPNPKTTTDIFRGMINDVTSGARNADSAIYDATRNLQSSIN